MSTKTKSKDKEKTPAPVVEYFKGKINTHEEAAPEMVMYENGTLRMTGSLVYQTKDKEKQWDTISFVAYNKNAEKIHTAITLEKRSFTLSGEVRQGNLYAQDVKLHQLQSIEGTINHIDKKDDGTTKLLVGVKNDKDMTFTFYATIPKDKELNGAKIEKGGLIAINGEGSVFDKKDDSRAVDIRAWNVAKNKEELDAIIAQKQEAKQETQKEVA